MDFSSKLGGKLGPSWHQNLENKDPKTMSKKELKKMNAGSRNSCVPEEGGSLKSIHPEAPWGTSLGILSLHFVPKGHGGGLRYPTATNQNGTD